MKIGILTQPLHSNYGGLMQAWALQKTLAELGHEVIIINRVYGKPKIPLWRKIASKIKNELLIRLGKRKRYQKVTESLIQYSEQNVIPFREHRYLGVSPEIKSNEDLVEYIESQKFDAYVVGSDQVWRPMFSPNLMTYFLDFAKDNSEVKKIAYAASFGVDCWELTESDTEKARDLAPLFDLITVRESSAVDLVNQYLGCSATHVLDPTMLRSKEDYRALFQNPTCKLRETDGELFCYVLDKAPFVSEVIEACKQSTGLNPYFCMPDPPCYYLEIHEDKKNCIVPPVEQWLKSFDDAKMVVTDSFHGVVFSIIFNKPFWVVFNNSRGAARFTSLLKQFNLEHRIVDSLSSINWETPIDWNVINKTRSALAKYSRSLLLLHLTSTL